MIASLMSLPSVGLMKKTRKKKKPLNGAWIFLKKRLRLKKRLYLLSFGLHLDADATKRPQPLSKHLKRNIPTSR